MSPTDERNRLLAEANRMLLVNIAAMRKAGNAMQDRLERNEPNQSDRDVMETWKNVSKV